MEPAVLFHPFIKIVALIVLLYSSGCSAKTKTDIIPLTTAECGKMQDSTVITRENPVGCNRLQRVNFQYINFAGNTATGSIGGCS